jgi:hypothetical protein
MAIINGSLTIRAASTVTAKSKQIWAGSTTIQSKSTLTTKSKAILSGATTISSSSKFSIFWLEMKARSSVTIGNTIIQRLGNVSMSSVSNLISSLVKVGSQFLRRVFIEGDAITNITLEGGGSEYMKVNQDIELTSGDYLEINVKIFDEKGNPKDISGFASQWTMGGLNKTVGNGIEIIDSTNGLLLITLTSEDTEKSYGSYPHRAIITDAQGHDTTVFKGQVKIN